MGLTGWTASSPVTSLLCLPRAMGSIPLPIRALVPLHTVDHRVASLLLQLAAPSHCTQGMFGPDPMATVCRNCQAHITTATTVETGVMAWVAAGLMCAVGLWCCAPIPLVMDSLKDVTHRCPSRNCMLGKYKAKM